MNLLGVEYGVFPEIVQFNRNFLPDSMKLRYVLETTIENPLVSTPKELNLEDFHPYFQTLKTHSCGQCIAADNEASGYVHESSKKILSLNKPIDIAHYMEHMVLDLQYQLSKPEQLSGVTLKMSNTENQFITYVECTDPRIGVFSVNVVLAMMHQALYAGSIDPRYHFVLRLARRLRESGISSVSITEIQKEFACDAHLANYCINTLNAFAFSDVRLLSTLDVMPAEVGPVLIIEDNEQLRMSVAEELNEMGYQTLLAPDGQTGLARLREYVVSVVLLDINLPDIDGISIAKWILEIQPSVLVILTSGYIAIPGNKTVMSNAIRFLPKPYELPHLSDMLKSGSVS